MPRIMGLRRRELFIWRFDLAPGAGYVRLAPQRTKLHLGWIGIDYQPTVVDYIPGVLEMTAHATCRITTWPIASLVDRYNALRHHLPGFAERVAALQPKPTACYSDAVRALAVALEHAQRAWLECCQTIAPVFNGVYTIPENGSIEFKTQSAIRNYTVEVVGVSDEEISG